MDQKGFSKGYKSDILRYLEPIGNNAIHGLSELRDIVSCSSSSMSFGTSDNINSTWNGILQEGASFKEKQF